MTISNLGESWNGLERIYSSPLTTEVTLHATIKNSAYENWRKATRAVFRHVGFEKPFWSDLARETTKLSMIIHNSPIAPADPMCQEILGSSFLSKSYNQGLQYDGLKLLDEFWASLTVLRKVNCSPYIDWLLETNDPDKDCNLVVFKSDWLRSAKKSIRAKPALRHFTVVPASSFLEPCPLECVYVCGALSLFPTSIYCAGRAESVIWSIFEWMKPFFPEQNPSLYEGVQYEPKVNLIASIETNVSAEIEEEIDTSGLWLVQSALEDDLDTIFVEELELVDSVPLILATGAQTFVPFYDRIQVAFPQDSTGPNSIVLGKKHGADISVDDFVILRSYGETDIIIQLADQQLGRRSHELRSSQHLWKSSLRNKVADSSIQSALNSLKSLGSNVANEQNLRNWMSPRNIRTQEKAEFDIILRYCGLESDSERIWTEMGEIIRAHTKAGRLLKQQLANELTTHSGSELLAQERIDVSIPGISSGTLIAIKVESVGDPRPVRESSLLRIFEPWQS